MGTQKDAFNFLGLKKLDLWVTIWVMTDKEPIKWLKMGCVHIEMTACPKILKLKLPSTPEISDFRI